MSDAIVKFIVLGVIPGTDYQLGFVSGLTTCSVVIVLALGYIAYRKRRLSSRFLRQLHVTSITI